MNVLLNKNKQASTQLVSMSEEILNLNTSQLEKQMEDLVYESKVANLLMHDTKTNQEVFKKYMEESPYLSRRNAMVIVNTHNEVVYQDGEHPISDSERIASQIELKQNPMSTIWRYMQDSEPGAIVLGSEITLRKEVVGYIYTSFDERVFTSSFNKTPESNNVLIVVDDENRYLFGQAKFEKGVHVSLHDEQVTIGGKNFYVVSKQVEGMNWQVANLVSSDYVLEEIHNFRNMLLFYTMAVIIILAILSSLTYHSIYDPIHNILTSIRDLDESNLSMIQVTDDGKDEIHELSVNYNGLIRRIEELLATVESEQGQIRETQILLLQAQINPHFLFNTLNTLRYLAIINEDKPVSEGISALAKLLRNTIVDSNEMVSIDEEIENVKNYIVIQKLRYGDLFETVYNIDKDVRMCQILKFLLQPIVENSILHAFEEDAEHQVLTIRAKNERGCLKIEIGDNGKGFLKEETMTMNKKLSSIGIANIQDRIRLMYGEAYSMEIESELGKGTIVTLRLPLMDKGAHYV